MEIPQWEKKSLVGLVSEAALIGRAHRRGNSGRFSVSSCLMVCWSVFFLDESDRIVVHSEQHKLQRTVYSTFEHAATILRVRLAWTELRQGLSLCLDRTAHRVNGSSCSLGSDSSNSHDSNVAVSWLPVCCNNAGQQKRELGGSGELS